MKKNPYVLDINKCYFQMDHLLVLKMRDTCYSAREKDLVLGVGSKHRTGDAFVVALNKGIKSISVMQIRGSESLWGCSPQGH